MHRKFLCSARPKVRIGSRAAFYGHFRRPPIQVQATLVAKSHLDLHRRLGVFGAGLAIVFVVLGFSSVVEQARRGFDLSGDISRVPGPPGVAPLAATVGLLFFFFDFAVLVAVGLLRITATVDVVDVRNHSEASSVYRSTQLYTSGHPPRFDRRRGRRRPCPLIGLSQPFTDLDLLGDLDWRDSPRCRAQAADFTSALGPILPYSVLCRGSERLLGLANPMRGGAVRNRQDRKSTRLNSSHPSISYAVF